MGDARDDAAAGAGLRWHVPRWVVGALVLPVAVFAAVATSPPSPNATASIFEAGNDWVVTTDGCSPQDECSHDGPYARTADGWAVIVLTSRASTEKQWQDCSKLDPEVCYRSVEGGTSVERSGDGGLTWEFEWGLTAVDVALLERERDGEGPAAESSGVGVFTGPDGEEVWAAMGQDGLAMRHVDGTWERVDFDWSGRDRDAVLVVPSEALAQPGTYWPRALALAIGWAVSCGAVVVMIAASVLADGKDRRWWVLPLAIVLGFPCIVLAFAPAMIVESDSGGSWPPVEGSTLFGIFWWLVGLLLLGALGFMADIWQDSTRWAVVRVATWSVAAGVVLGLIGPFVGAHPGQWAAIGVFGVAIVAVIVEKLRRNKLDVERPALTWEP